MIEAVMMMSGLNQRSNGQESPVYQVLVCTAGLSDKHTTVS